MTADPVLFLYPSPSGDADFYAAFVDGEFVFPFLEIAEALFYKNADRLSPTCDEAHTRRIRFQNTRNARKCVTLAGLFVATPAQRDEDGTEAAVGPAAHFHRWLRAVVLPLLDVEAWPPRESEKSIAWKEWASAECERITRGLAIVAWKTSETPTAAAPAPQPVKPPHPLGRSTPQGFEFSAAAIDEALGVKR